MIKKISAVLLALIMVFTLFACDRASRADDTLKDGGSDTSVQGGSAEPDKIADGGFTSTAFSSVKEGELLSDTEMKVIIAKIPSDRYESYPNTHGAPVSATLYKDGKVINIDSHDERLIRLTNLFNNCVYYSKCAYTQGLLSADYINKNVKGNSFRLELTYTPHGEAASPYGNCTTGCDTVIITDSFTLIAHDLPGYEGMEEEYPFRAVGFDPLYGSYNWLEFFGF